MTYSPKPTQYVEVNGFALRRIRELSGIKATDAAHQAGITPDYLWRIERGIKHRLSRPVLLRVLRAMCLEDARIILASPIPGYAADDEGTDAGDGAA